MSQTSTALVRESPATRSHPRVLVLIPAKDEASNLPRVLEELAKVHSLRDTLVIDDGSEDRTSEVAREAGCRLVRHHLNLGYGASLLTGYLYAVKHGFQVLVQMDGDGQHPPAEIPKLLDPILRGLAEVVVGSRYLESKGYRPSFFRRLGARPLSWLGSLWTGRRITDPTSGFQALTGRALEHLCLDGFPEDYPDIDVLINLHRRGIRLEEAPVRMRDRSSGSSMHRGIKVLYYFYRLAVCLMLLPVRRPSLYRNQRKSKEARK